MLFCRKRKRKRKRTRRPHVLKIVVEGHDYAVLMGFLLDSTPVTDLPLLIEFEVSAPQWIVDLHLIWTSPVSDMRDFITVHSTTYCQSVCTVKFCAMTDNPFRHSLL